MPPPAALATEQPIRGGITLQLDAHTNTPALAFSPLPSAPSHLPVSQPALFARSDEGTPTGDWRQGKAAIAPSARLARRTALSWLPAS